MSTGRTGERMNHPAKSRTGGSEAPVRVRLPDARLVIIVIVLAWATILLNDVARSAELSDAGAWPSMVDRLLAAPIALTDVSDLRAYAAPVGLAAMLIFCCVRRRPAAGADEKEVSRGGRWTRRVPEALMLVVWIASIASALVNETWEVSRGYLFSLTAYLAWVIVLSRVLNAISPGRLLAAASVVGALAAALSLWHLYALGERFFQLPVGPVTVTAGLGAFLGAMGGAWLLGWLSTSENEGTKRGARTPKGAGFENALWAGVFTVIAVWMLWAAGRRGAFLGLFTAWLVAGTAVIWYRFQRRAVRGALAAVLLVFVVAAAMYVRQQTQSTARVASVPLKIRYTYWQHMAKMIPRKPLLGYGPDYFACRMTTEMAPIRAEMPHILHGGVDYDAHNEWWQAFFELGIPGGAAYLALPLVVAFLALRAWRRSNDRARRAALLACAAGLIEIVVAETSSINLRYFILSPWYWTLIGVTLALLRPASTQGSLSADRGTSGFLPLRIGCAVGAATILVVVAQDVRAARYHAMGRSHLSRDDQEAVDHLQKALGRFGSNRWLSTRTYLATARTNLLRRARLNPDGTISLPNAAATQPSTSGLAEGEESNVARMGREAVEAWDVVYRRAAGYVDTGFRLAEAQMLAGDLPAARETLEHYLTRIDPYDKQANILQMEIGNLAPDAQLECVLRSLRSDRWDMQLLTRVQALLKEPAIAAQWPGRVARARADVRREDETTWEDRLAPEVLRVEAFRVLEQGDLSAANEAQMAAADAYRALAAKDSRLRRLTAAEADTWYLAARFIFDLDAGNYLEAFRRVVQAERFATEGLRTERIPDPPANVPYVGGKVMPLEAPESLRDLWRFSAMMYLATKGDPRQITLRIQWSLPPDQNSTTATRGELGRIAAELVARLSTLPEVRRPENFGRLVELARQYSPPATNRPS